MTRKKTLVSLLRGISRAPIEYTPVPSAVGRSDAEFLAYQAKAGIKTKPNHDGDKSKQETEKVEVG